MQQSATLFVPLRDGDDRPFWQALRKGGEPIEVRSITPVAGGLQLQLAGTELRESAFAADEEGVMVGSVVASHRLLASGGELTMAKVVALAGWLQQRARVADVGLVASLLTAGEVGAVQWLLAEPSFDRAELDELAASLDLDLNLIALTPRLESPGILLMDMDSTAIQIECIDEIAKLAGVGAEVAEVTELAMQGKLDFCESLRARVATLTGHPVSILETVAAAIPLTPGLTELIAALHRRQWQVGIVSGGFTFFTDILKARLGLDFTRANSLGIADGKLTGQVAGEIVDASVKEQTLRQWAADLGLELSQTIAAGDGANDLKMLGAAGLGVAFHAKPVVRAQAAAGITRGGIEAIYYLVADNRDLL